MKGSTPYCKSRKGRTLRAFTFVEILAAMVFLAILIPAILEGISLANRAAVISERTAVAVQLAENKLGELTVDNAWASGESSGDFGNDWPGYRWKSVQGSWDMDDMTTLDVEVSFSVQGQDRSVQLSTLVSATATQTQGSTL